MDGKGLALTFFLRRAFQRDITSSINNFKSKSESMINKLLTEENFDAKKFDAGTYKRKIRQLSKIGKNLYRLA